jgi:hypothetical protein
MVSQPGQCLIVSRHFLRKASYVTAVRLNLIMSPAPRAEWETGESASRYFYWDDIPRRRLGRFKVDSATALG